MTFRDVLEQALQDAFTELWPTAGHWDRRTPQLAAHVAENPCITRLFDAAAGVECGDAAAVTARPPAEPSGGCDAMNGTQLVLSLAESAAP